jgi:1-acyl-sn-glycerol-3-phosphate acyltransferase
VGLQIYCYGHITTTPTLFVANHISWLDIFALLATFPVIFVSKQEVANWPILGRLTRQVGTLFIQRGQFQAATATANKMSQALLNHQNVLFFPEGTSTKGIGVKRFHARLFQAAIQAGVPVQPIALRYPQGEGINPIVPYIGKDIFISHVWRVLGEKKFTVELWFCPAIPVGDKRRRELADYAQQQILTRLQQQEKTFSYLLRNGITLSQT